MQLVDDMLDYTGSTKTLGKPALNDLKSGLATAPVLYAAESHPQLRPLILRKFENPGDVKLAQELVFSSQGIQRTRQLAVEHAQKAADMVSLQIKDLGLRVQGVVEHAQKATDMVSFCDVNMAWPWLCAGSGACLQG